MRNYKQILAALIPLTYLLILLFQIDLSMLGDMGRHLILGKIIVHCHCVPETNLFSYTAPDFPIINHEWLTEVIFYFSTVVLGLKGLLVLKIIIFLSTASLLYYVGLKKGSLFWVTIFSVLNVTILSMRFSVLPENFSYLFIALFIFLIEKYRQSKQLLILYLLPVIQIFWVNMHIYFIFGIVIYGLFLLEECMLHKKIIKPLLLPGIILILSTFLNPKTIQEVLLPFTFLHHYGFTVEENENPFIILTASGGVFNYAYTYVLQIFIFYLLLLLFIVCFFFKKQWKQIFYMGNGLIATGLAMFFTRCISLFSILSFIPLIQTFTFIEGKIRKNHPVEMVNFIKACVVLFVGIVLLVHVYGLISYNRITFGFEPFAQRAVAFMKKAHIHGKFFNNYNIGNYLIYSFYPEQRVYVDARPVAYPLSFFKNYNRMMTNDTYFNQQVNRYNINTVVFDIVDNDPTLEAPFLLRLIKSKNWIPVYGDGTVTILVRNNQLNKKIIDNYQIKVQQ